MLESHQSNHPERRRFPTIHRWMLLPFLIATSGFYFTYWSVFTEVPLHQHMHGLTATAWYVLLVLQPWLAKQNDIVLHRKIGFIGLFLAGAVVFSVLQIIRNNMTNDNLSPVLRYGLTWGDFIFLIGFSHAVLMGMWNSKDTSVHARYMIASAIWALMPALARLIYFPIVATFGFPPPVSFLTVVYWSAALILCAVGALIAVDYRRERRMYSSYLTLWVGTVFFALTVAYMGNAEWWRSFCDRLLA